MAFDISIFMQGFHVVFNGVLANACRFSGIGNRYAPMFASNFQNLHGEFRKLT